jgi:pimeloyl-ACP methyl ester carboxylesterase
MKNPAIARERKQVDYHRQFHPTYFKSNDMDFLFQWTMGSSVHGGAGIGESYHTAALIKDGDPDSWSREWKALAERVRERAENIHGTGHRISASDSFLRAAIYYRSALAVMSPLDLQFRSVIQQMRECFRTGGALLNSPVESFDVNYKGAKLTGYFQRAISEKTSCPTLIMIGGAETFSEDLYYYIAPSTIKRGWNFATVDLPGQGDAPFSGTYFCSGTETPMKAIIDKLLTRHDVDPDRLAAYGISAGGYFVPRAAVYEPRIKACIANSLIPNLSIAFKKYGLSNFKGIKMRIADIRMPFKMRMMRQIAWRAGLSTERICDLPNTMHDCFFNPSEIKCPMLILIGEGEMQNPWSRAQQEQGLAAFSNPNKQISIGPFNEGASNHCMGDNLSLMSSFAFDWLEEVLQ